MRRDAGTGVRGKSNPVTMKPTPAPKAAAAPGPGRLPPGSLEAMAAMPPRTDPVAYSGIAARIARPSPWLDRPSPRTSRRLHAAPKSAATTNATKQSSQRRRRRSTRSGPGDGALQSPPANATPSMARMTVRERTKPGPAYRRIPTATSATMAADAPTRKGGTQARRWGRAVIRRSRPSDPDGKRAPADHSVRTTRLDRARSSGLPQSAPRPRSSRATRRSLPGSGPRTGSAPSRGHRTAQSTVRSQTGPQQPPGLQRGR